MDYAVWVKEAKHDLATVCQKMLVLAKADWPDPIDKAAILAAVVLFLGLPLLGYWFMVIDVRAYLRALRGALMIVKNHLPRIPSWAKEYTPICIRSLGLEMPCTEEDLKQAYRQLAEELHPDRGGDRNQFLQLQSHFEEAKQFLRQHYRK